MLSLPTAPFHEHAVAAHLRAFARTRGLPARTDRFGNLLLRCRRGRAAAPLAFVAHMDHPGFEILAVRGNTARLEPLGDTRGPHALGARIRAGAARGLITAVGKTVTARFDRAPRPGDFAQWDLPAFARLGRRIYSRALDDGAGCAALVAALEKLAQGTAPLNLWAIFTRAEEVGFAGATALAASGLLPRRAPIISIEMSKALPGAEIGRGYVVRLGDRAALFDPCLTEFLLGVARKLGAPFQARLMDGGTCEATAFQAFGYAAGGVCCPLGHYHNQGARGIAPELIHAEDFAGLTRFLVAVAEQAGGWGPSRPRLKKRLRAILRGHRARLIRTAGEGGRGW